MKKVTQLPGTSPKLSPADLAGLISEVWAILPAQLEYVVIQGKMRKKKYDSLIEVGFTEQQALEIVKSTPPFE